jgi:hypothetical protein
MFTSRLTFTWLSLQLLLTSCSILPTGTAQPIPVNIRTNLLTSENDLTLESWVKNRVTVEQTNTQSEVLYEPPAPIYTYPLNRLTVTPGLGTPSIYQVIAGPQQNHLYRMTAVLQDYDEGAGIVIRFAKTLDKSTYPDAEFLVTLNKGVQRITFEFYISEAVDSFVFSLEPQLEPGQYIDVGELRVWDSTPNLMANETGNGCQLFPSNNFWNVPIDDWAVHPDSSKLLRGLRNGEDLIRNGYFLRMGFGARSYRNIPVGKFINIVQDGETAPDVFGVKLKFVSFDDPLYPPASPFDAFRSPEYRRGVEAYPQESDDVLYPIPADVAIQGIPFSSLVDVSGNKGYPTDASGYPDPAIDPDVNKDWPAYILQKSNNFRTCKLYEIYKLTKIANQPPEESWRASSAVAWDLSSNVIEGKRGKEFLTSVSASGLPLLPSLVRYDEIERGEIRHALGMITRGACGMAWPARHIATTATDLCVPLGLRLRLKSTFLSSSNHANCTVNSFSKEGKAIILALQRYGAVIVDSGTSLVIIGEHDSRWGPPIDRYGNNIGGSNTNRQVDISNESSQNNCWPRVEDFEVVDTDRYAHWSFATNAQGDIIKSQIYSIYNNQPVYNSMAVYGE